jgi:hypothetical protein
MTENKNKRPCQNYMSVKIMIKNEVFILGLYDHPRDKSINLYYFEMQPLTEAHQYDMDLLGDSLAMICNSETGLSSIVLDCSALKSGELLKRFLKLSLGRALGITNPAGLDKFMIITSSRLVKVMSNSIIKLKKAAHYTKICSSKEEAICEL